MYDGATFAREGIVAVTINYRLFAAGLLYVGDRPGSGNFALLDQIAALEWVQENIAAFGGDPSQVTVVGESAGAHYIGELLAAPAARRLFRRGILTSGAASYHVRSEAAAVIGTELLDRLGVRSRDDDTFVPITSADLLTQQLAVNAETLALLAAGGVAPDLLTLCFGTTFYPVYGTDVLPEPALDVIANGAARDIDLLVGTTADEWTMFVPPGDAAKYALKQALAVADAAFTPIGRTGAEVLGSYRRHRSGHSDLDSIIPFMTDFAFRIPAIRLAETAQRHNPRTYMFQFAWKGQFGAVHGLDIPFMFDSLEKARNVVAALGAPNPPQSLATTMHGAWVNFVKTGSPQHPNLPEWPAYDPVRRATMLLDVESRVVDDPDGEERRLWDGVQY